jgi:hypothetical protein
VDQQGSVSQVSVKNTETVSVIGDIHAEHTRLEQSLNEWCYKCRHRELEEESRSTREHRS